MNRYLLIFAITLSVNSGFAAQKKPEVTQSVQAAKAVDEAVNQLTMSYYQQVPESATYNGTPEELSSSADARLNDRSIAGNKARVTEMEKRLAELKATPTEGVDDETRRDRASLIALFDGALGPSRVADYGTSFDEYGIWYLPYAINQNSGPTVSIPKLMEAQQLVRNAAEAQEYLDRLTAFPGILDGSRAKLQHDVALGAIPPDFIINKSKAVVDAFAAVPAKNNALYSSFVSKLKAANVPNADSFADKVLSQIDKGVLPAYRRISSYLADIAPQAPHDAGLWRLPNGAALYQATIKHMTDTDLDPNTIHQMGLDEVARITGEMDTLLRAQGYTKGTVGERMATMTADPRFIYPNTTAGKAALLASIQGKIDTMNTLLPTYFGTLPKHPMVLRTVPEFSQDSASAGAYDPPAPDGSRPGIYWVNLRDTAMLPKFAAPTLTFHESIPGHHMQMAISIDQKAPFIAKSFYSNSAGEGWALYAESLAAEMGMYKDDPFGDLGRLRDELHRAIRLVVDTGMHAKKWSREQALDYMMKTEGVGEPEAVSEIERYVAWPGQALGYKIGMLRIQQLRKEAEAAYGDKFDIRAFHDQFLMISSSALPVIEQEMRAWIAKANAKPKTKS